MVIWWVYMTIDDQSHFLSGCYLTSLLESGSNTTFWRNQMRRPKPQLAPKMIQRMLKSGRQALVLSSTHEPSNQNSSTWLQKSATATAIIRGTLVKMCSLHGWEMLKAIIAITQMLFTNRNKIFDSRPPSKPPFSSQACFAISIPPYVQQQSLLYVQKMAIIEICPATWMPNAVIICTRFVMPNRELLGRSTLSLSAVLVYPIKTMKKKLRLRSQQRYCRSPGYCRNFSDNTVVVYWVSEQLAITLKSEKLVARPARHYLMSSTMEVMLATWEVKGAEMDAYAWERERPTSACLRAPQSFAPSPHIDTFISMCWQVITILALSLGLVRANTDTEFMKVFSTSVRSPMMPGKNWLKALPVMQSWQLVVLAFAEITSIKCLPSEYISSSLLSRPLEMPTQSSMLSFSLEVAQSLLILLLLITISAKGVGCLLLTSVVASSSSWQSNLSSTNTPLLKSQMIMPLVLLEMSHLQLMLDPVRVLSPVIITHAISAVFRVAMAPFVYGFNLFQNTQKPLKARSLSASPREMVGNSASLTLLLAMLSTLKPWEAYCFSISSQLEGMVCLFMIVVIIQGEPLQQTSHPLVMLFLQTTLMRCRSESNQNLRKTIPLWPRSLQKAKMTLGSLWDWLRWKRPNWKVLISMGSPMSSSVASILMMELLEAMLVRMALRKGAFSAVSSILWMLGSLFVMEGQNLPSLAGTSAQKSMQSQVSVPVLSKQQNSIMPPMITLFCAMQKIPFFSSFSIAQMMPNVMLTGREGGTVMVRRSKNFCTRSYTFEYRWMRMMSTMKVPAERQKRKAINLQDSLWKMLSCSLGKRMMRTSCPLVVTKLVRTTHTGMPYFSLKASNFPIFFLSLTCTMVVPSNTKALLSMVFDASSIFSKESAFLTMGTDSPVSAHSLMSALPQRMMPSKGILMGSLRKTISPGTTSMEGMTSILPSRSTLTGTSQQAMLNILLLSCSIWQRLTDRPNVEMKKSTPAKQKYFWFHVQQETLKRRKMQRGRRIYLKARSTQLGLSTIMVPGPQVFFNSWAWQSLSPLSYFLALTRWAILSRQSYILTLTVSFSSMMQVMQRLTKYMQKTLFSSSIMNTFHSLLTMLTCSSKFTMQKSVASSSPQNQKQNLRLRCGYLHRDKLTTR